MAHPTHFPFSLPHFIIRLEMNIFVHNFFFSVLASCQKQLFIQKVSNIKQSFLSQIRNFHVKSTLKPESRCIYCRYWNFYVIPNTHPYIFTFIISWSNFRTHPALTAVLERWNLGFRAKKKVTCKWEEKRKKYKKMDDSHNVQ